MANFKRYLLIPDPIYDSIHIPERLEELIENPLFQRLRFLKQLAFSYLIYPSTTHTRFEHSLGVFHLTHLTLNKLRIELKSRVVVPKKYLDDISSIDLIDSARLKLFDKIVKEENIQYIYETLIAALYHDIGHSAFGHVINILNKRNPNYPKLSNDKLYVKEILGEKTLLNKLINDFSEKIQKDHRCDKIKVENIIEMITRGRHKEPDLNFLGELIHSSIDLDRIDYLNRDCFYSGIINAKIPYNYLISNIRIVPHIRTRKDKQREVHFYLCFDKQARYSLEFILISRYFMYNQIYHHYKEKIVENMITKAIEISIKEGDLEYNQLFKLNDETALQALKRNKKAKNIVEKIYERKIYYPVLKTNFLELDDIVKLKLIEEDLDDFNFIRVWEEKLAEKIGLDSMDVIIDIPTSSYYETAVLLWDEDKQELLNFEDHSQFSNIKLTPMEYVLCAISRKDKIKEAKKELFNTLD